MIKNSEIIAILQKHNFWEATHIEFGVLRPTYLDTLKSYLNNTLIKVIVGQRRTGKSRLLKMMMNYLITAHHIPPQNILYINKEWVDFEWIQSPETLMSAIKIYRKQLRPKGKIYLFLDEVQEIQDWEKAVNSLAQDTKHPVEIFITGSNAHLLSGELASYLSGRYLTLTLYPFSFQEYIDLKGCDRNKTVFLEYIQTGGMPELYQLETAETKQNYMQNLLDSIVLRDIVQRNQVRDVFLLKKLIQFTIDSVGSMLSISSIIKSLKQNGYKTNPETIGNYLQFCQQAFFIHECARYDLRGKQILVGERKYYLNDLAFKHYFHSGFDFNINRLLENAVYLSLLRQGYQVYVGRYQQHEIDFVAEKNGEKIYVQVSYLLTDQKVIEREFGNLLQIQDNYPKWVVTLDEISIPNIQGVYHKPIWEFIV